jgi:hypothetical protein
LRGAEQEFIKEISDAADSFGDCIGRRWVGPLGDQQLHTDAGYHQENIERGGDYCRYHLAFECLWNHRKHLPNSYWEVKRGGKGEQAGLG